MELKWQKESLEGSSQDVLIVPLWNWNKIGDCIIGTEFGFNRTFMELKFGLAGGALLGGVF